MPGRESHYPGTRSDSDLFTFGYRFKPWTGAPIATAEEITARCWGRNASGQIGNGDAAVKPLPVVVIGL